MRCWAELQIDLQIQPTFVKYSNKASTLRILLELKSSLFKKRKKAEQEVAAVFRVNKQFCRLPERYYRNSKQYLFKSFRIW